MRTIGLILAGGQGRRLNKAKGWRLVGGHPILERVYAALRPVVDEIVLVGDAPLPCAWHVLRVPDELPGGGPLAALHTGMKALPRRAIYCSCLGYALRDNASFGLFVGP